MIEKRMISPKTYYECLFHEQHGYSSVIEPANTDWEYQRKVTEGLFVDTLRYTWPENKPLIDFMEPTIWSKICSARVKEVYDGEGVTGIIFDPVALYKGNEIHTYYRMKFPNRIHDLCFTEILSDDKLWAFANLCVPDIDSFTDDFYLAREETRASVILCTGRVLKLNKKHGFRARPYYCHLHNASRSYLKKQVPPKTCENAMITSTYREFLHSPRNEMLRY